MAEQRPRIMYFKEYLPTPVCVVLSMFFALVFQFNGGVFLPTAVQMSSALGCIQEDVMMAGYASFIGMTLIFPILFRLKFRFTTRRIFLTVCPVLIVCNLITLHVNSLPIFILVCLVSGFFRMWGTFECFSNMRLSVTPSGNFSVFYPVIYIIVLESIQLSGLVATHISDWANWRYMHWFVIGMLLIVWACVWFFTRPFRMMKNSRSTVSTGLAVCCGALSCFLSSSSVSTENFTTGQTAWKSGQASLLPSLPYWSISTGC